MSTSNAHASADVTIAVNKPASVRSTKTAEAPEGLIARGLPVLPLVARSKEPDGTVVPHGFKSASTDPKIVRQWFRNAHRNVGIAPPVGVLVLDVDPRNGGDESLAKLVAEHGALPATWTVETGGGGTHYYFTCPADLTITNKTAASGLDVEGHGEGASRYLLVNVPARSGRSRPSPWRECR